MTKVRVTNADRQKSYFKYYEMGIEKGPQDKYDKINQGPMNPKYAMKIHDRNNLFMEGYLPGEFGYCVLEDGTGYVANLTKMPGVTAEMIDWWFAWHPIDRLRYAIWDPEDHYNVVLEDKEAALDTTKSLSERNWGSVHFIQEDIGMGVDSIILHFKKPSEFGYDMSKIGTNACGTIKCANGVTLGQGHKPDAPAVMTHFIRPTGDGVELRSRFWLGWQIRNGKPVKMIPDGVRIPEIAPKTLLEHNVKEYTHLAKILPQVYEEEALAVMV